MKKNCDIFQIKKEDPQRPLLPYSHNFRKLKLIITRGSANLFQRIIFALDFLVKSKHSPYKKNDALFGRREHQAKSANIAHSHIILAVNEKNLSPEEINFVNELANGSIIEIMKSKNIKDFIENGIIQCQDDIHKLVDDASLFLTHKCNDRCKVKMSNGEMRCCMPKYIHMTPDNSKQHFIDLPTYMSDECWNVLHKIGLSNNVF